MSERSGDALVVFGITGDLARKMTFRSLYRLEKRGFELVAIRFVAAGLHDPIGDVQTEADVSRAGEVGRKLFPPTEAGLITELIRRDLPYYDATLSRDFIAGMTAFLRSQGVVDGEVPYERIVATQFAPLWKG